MLFPPISFIRLNYMVLWANQLYSCPLSILFFIFLKSAIAN